MSDDEQPPKRVGNVTMQIDAVRDQLELYDDVDGDDVDGDEAELAPRSVAPPPLPPRGASAPTKPKVAPATLAIGVVVAVAAVGAALWVSGLLVEEPPPAAEAPAMEIGPIEIDTAAPPTAEE